MVEYIAVVENKSFSDYGAVDKILCGRLPFVLLSRAALDASVQTFAEKHGVESIVYPPNYKSLKKNAVRIRDARIIAKADCLIVFYHKYPNKSVQHLISLAERKQIPIQEIKTNKGGK